MRVCVVFVVALPAGVAGQSRGPLDLANAAVPANARRVSYGAIRTNSVNSECRPPRASIPLRSSFMADATWRSLGTWIHGRWPWHGLPTLFARLRATIDWISRVIAIGHSAGGHLAMWLAARPNVPQGSEIYTSDPIRLAGVVNLDGPADLNATLAIQRPVCGSPVVTDLLGGTPEERPERYRAASPIELLPFNGHQAFLAGRMFAAQVPSYEAAVKRTGGAVETMVLPAGDHFVFIDPQSDVWPAVLKNVRQALSMRE